MVFSVEPPYEQGHVLTEVEAGVLNQTYAENLRNNFAPKIKAARVAVAQRTTGKAEKDLTDEDIESITNDQLDIDALRAEFAEYAKTYEFGARVGGRILDPVERELWNIAEASLKNALRQNNIKLNSVSRDQMDKLVSELIESKPEFRAEAERRVEATKAAAGIEIGSLLAQVRGNNGEAEAG